MWRKTLMNAAEGQPHSTTFGGLRHTRNTRSVVECGRPSAAFSGPPMIEANHIVHNQVHEEAAHFRNAHWNHERRTLF